MAKVFFLMNEMPRNFIKKFSSTHKAADILCLRYTHLECEGEKKEH